MQKTNVVMINWGYDDWNFIRTSCKRPELLRLFKRYVESTKDWRIKGSSPFIAFLKKHRVSATEIKEDYNIGFNDLAPKYNWQ